MGSRLGIWLSELLRERGWGYSDLARTVGVSAGNVGDIVAGRRSIPRDRVADYGRALGFDSDSKEMQRLEDLAALAKLGPPLEERLADVLEAAEDAPALREEVIRLRNEVRRLRDHSAELLARLAALDQSRH